MRNPNIVTNSETVARREAISFYAERWRLLPGYAAAKFNSQSSKWKKKAIKRYMEMK